MAGVNIGELPPHSRSLKIAQRRIDCETRVNQRCYSGNVALPEQCAMRKVTRGVTIHPFKVWGNRK